MLPGLRGKVAGRLPPKKFLPFPFARLSAGLFLYNPGAAGKSSGEGVYKSNTREGGERVVSRFNLYVVPLSLLLFPAGAMPAYAAVDLDFLQGADNVISLVKMLLIAAAFVAFIVEMFHKRNLLYLAAVILLTALLMHIASPGRMDIIGRSILQFIGAGPTTSGTD